MKFCQQAANVLNTVESCDSPTLLELTLDLSKLEKSQREKCLELVVSAYETFTEKVSKASQQIGMYAVIAEGEHSQAHARRRRAAETVIYLLIFEFPLYLPFSIQHDFSIRFCFLFYHHSPPPVQLATGHEIVEFVR